MIYLKKLRLLTKIHRTGKLCLSSRNYVQLAGRPFLLGSEGKGFPQFLNGQKDYYPHIINAKEKGVEETGSISPEDCAHLLK